jgi:tetratricopeptide (TPR) repeat protein
VPPRTTPSDARISRYPDDEWLDEPRFSATIPTRSRALRWLVLLIVLGLLGMVAAVFGRKYAGGVKQLVAGGASSTAAGDSRARLILDEGERALSDGDLENAKESFDKASVLAERDPRALIDVARLAAVRADLDWLRARLLADDPLVLASARRQLQESTQRAKKAIERAQAVSPEDNVLMRTYVDVLRIAGDRTGARLLVPKLAAIAQQPETAYALAALDLEEEAPSWPAILDRLRLAATAEGNLMRARSALVFALVRAGNVAEARTELDKIIAAPRPSPLLGELRAFVARAATPAADAAAAEDAAKRDAREVAAVRGNEEPFAPAGAGAAAGGAAAGGAGDFRTMLAQAAQAQAAHDYAKAEDLYRSALANGGDTEALAGLGDCARARGNSAQARSYYERVLAANPHYLPAMTSLADIRWESGDRAGAVALYRELVDTAPSGAVASRARERITQVETAKAAPAPRSTPSPTPTGGSAGGSGLPSGVDTSDLPGFKR